MAAKPIPTWQSKLNEVIRRDPRKAGILGVLLLVLVVMTGRLMLTGKTEPSPATASTVVTATGPGTDTPNLKAPGKKNTSVAMQRWLNGSSARITRNLFAVRLDYYPQSSAKGPISPTKQSPDEDKSPEQAADDLKDKQSRLQAMQQRAKQLKIQSTMMSAQPRALINGQLVKEGDFVTSDPGEGQATFKVLKIEPRRIVVEHEGVRLEILMK